MKPAILLAALGLVLAEMPATAQAPRENRWDISKVDVSKLPPASARKDITFDKDIQPLFKASCVRCHGSEKPKHGFRVDSLEAVLKGGREGKMVVPGDSKKSLLVAAVAQVSDKIAMPPKRRPGGPGGPGGQGGPNGGPPPGGGPPPDGAGNGGPPPGQPGGPEGGPGPGPGPGGPGGGGPPPKALTAEQVGLVRAWIDQGAK